MTGMLSMMARIANMLTVVLTLAALITLIVSGVGIMNSMLANVQARIREIGIRKALGATSREIRLQFLTEAVFLSLSGGMVGTLIGLAIPFSVRFFTPFAIPINPWYPRSSHSPHPSSSASSSALCPPTAPPVSTPSKPSNTSNIH